MNAYDWIRYDFLRASEQRKRDRDKEYQTAKYLGVGIQLVSDLLTAFYAAKADRCRCGNVAEPDADYCARCVYLRTMGRESEWPWRSAGHREAQP